QLRRDGVDQLVGRLGRQDRGRQQLERVAVVELAQLLRRARVLLGEAGRDLPRPPLRRARPAHRGREARRAPQPTPTPTALPMANAMAAGARTKRSWRSTTRSTGRSMRAAVTAPTTTAAVTAAASEATVAAVPP